MLTVLRPTGAGIERLDAPTAGCWIHAVAPNEAELAVIRAFSVPPDFLTHVDDPDERPRVEHSGASAASPARGTCSREKGGKG